MSPMNEERWPTAGEEIANSLSHGAGLVFAIAGTPFAPSKGKPVFRAHPKEEPTMDESKRDKTKVDPLSGAEDPAPAPRQTGGQARA